MQINKSGKRALNNEDHRYNNVLKGGIECYLQNNTNIHKVEMNKINIV